MSPNSYVGLIVMLLSWAIIPVICGQEIGPNVAKARSGSEFARALASPSVRTIYLMLDITVNDSDWRGLETPILVSQNMSIEGHPDLTEWPVLSLRSVKGMVRLAQGVALEMQRMVFTQNRRGIGYLSPGVDLFVPCCQEGGSAFILIQQAILIQPTCVPYALQVAKILNQSRPEAFPGRQVVGPLLAQPANCSNSTVAPLLQQCWPQWGVYNDVAVWGQDLDDGGVLRPSGYAVRMLQTRLVCQLVMSEECLQTLGIAGCYLLMGSRRSRSMPPAEAGSTVQQEAPDSAAGWTTDEAPEAIAPASPKGNPTPSSSLLLAIVLPTVLGGFLIAAAAVIFLIWQHVTKIQDGTASESAPAAAATDGTCQPTSKPGSVCQGVSEESLIMQPSDESGEGRLVRNDDGGTKSRCEEGGGGSSQNIAGFADVAVCCGLPERPLIVTPFTPHRSDLRLDVGCGSELTLLPVVRGQGNFGRVVEGIYGGERVAVKLVPDCRQWTPAAQVAGPSPSPGACAAGPGAAPGGPPPRVNVKSQLQSFAQEVEVLGRCDHPNVVRLRAACLKPPQLCLVMELMETTLEQVIHNPQRQLLPLETVMNIGMQVARGLEYLHPTIVHRDLKPGNVLLNDAYEPQPVVKITDFGLSRLRTTVMVTKHPEAGTPSYMAPELYDITNSTVTDKSDMYSLGVLLWEMLSGRLPWYGCDALVIAYAITINRARLPLSVIPPGRCPNKLRNLILSLWDHDPLRRPAAAEVVKQLALIQDELVRRDAALDLDFMVAGCGQDDIVLMGQRQAVGGEVTAATGGLEQGPNAGPEAGQKQ